MADVSRRFYVSTHSRPKAAGPLKNALPPAHRGFNTQPPEGGCDDVAAIAAHYDSFNTQPPEGG